MRKVFLPVVLSLSLVGCASTFKTKIASDPDDAVIYVNNEKIGKGAASYDVGPEYGFQKSFEVKIKRDGFKPLKHTIKNEPDYPRAISMTVLSALIGVVGSIYYLTQPASNPSNWMMLGLSGTCVLLSPMYLLSSNKFQPAYSFDLKKAGEPDNDE